MSEPTGVARSGDAATVEAIIAGGPYTLVVWDFDGVIANSEPVQAWAYRKVLEAYGVDPPPDFFADYIGHTEYEIWSQLRRRYDVPDEVDRLRELRRTVFLAEARRTLRPNWFVRPLVDAFLAQGAEQWIVSSGNFDVIRVLLARWSLDAMFSKIVAFEPESDIPYAKSDELKAAITGGRGRILAIEDHERYLRLAASLGAVTVGVAHEFNNMSPAAADFVISAGSGS